MQSLKTKSGYILRLIRNEEIISTLKDFIKDKKIKGGFLFGLGAGKEITDIVKEWSSNGKAEIAQIHAEIETLNKIFLR